MPSNISIVQGTNSKPVSSRALASYFSTHQDADGALYIGYPIIGSSEGRYPIDAIWVSPSKGIVVFDLVEGSDPKGFADRQDDSANKLESRLKTHKELMQRRDLVIPIHTLTFAPGVMSPEHHSENNYVLTNQNTLEHALNNLSWQNASSTNYAATLSALQNISTIRKTRIKRAPEKIDSRGAKLKQLEDSIATLDNLQGKAVIETVRGVQRIRGLAGSGKTIVLALKAAYLHAQHPDWRIAITFNTRSLKGQFRRLITTFSIEQTGEEPDWEKIRILNAWGAPGGTERDGIYHQFCRAIDAPYFDFKSAQRLFSKGDEFGAAVSKALSHQPEYPTLYDAMLVDEAQDFPPSFLRLCYEILSNDKRLVYAYDELQNLSNKSVAPPEEIFGSNPDGTPRVAFTEPAPGEPRSDIILEKCYRNSRPVLVTAHALGFGVYRKAPKGKTTGLVQMFENPRLWQDVGYDVVDGALQDGLEVTLQRSNEASPLFLETHSPIEDLIQFKVFNDDKEQVKWVVDEIKKNLTEDELRHDDIVVINPDPLTTRAKVGPIRSALFNEGISSHIAGIDTDPDVFFQTEVKSVTFTGIYRAKGNEAGMVYIINAQDCHSSAFNLASIRNRLFTAITRSKAWVRVLGVGSDMRKLQEEFSVLLSQQFRLKFRYPTQAERQQLDVVHRDMTAGERKRLKSRQKDLASLVKDLDAGIVHFEDLDNDLVQKLYEMLKGKG